MKSADSRNPKRPVSHEVRDYSEPLLQLGNTFGVGTFAVAGLANTTLKDGSALGKSILDGLPIFAVIQGILNIFDGAVFTVASAVPIKNLGQVFAAKADVAFWMPDKERYARGVLQAVSGFILAEGGIEAIIKNDATLQYLNLPWRYAIHSILEFVTSIIDLIRVYNARSEVNEGNEEEYSDVRSMAISNFLTKGFACAGWTTLAVLGMSNPVGWSCLVASSAIALYQNVPRACAFFKDVAQNISADGFMSAVKRRCPGGV